MSMASRCRPRALAACSAFVLLPALAACGSSDKAPAGTRTLTITLTDAGCSPAKATTPAGPTTFLVKNDGSSSVTELELKNAGGKIVGEREDIAAGLSGSFSVDLKPGRYEMECPNGTSSAKGVLVVTGS
jgi:iron uptake system component EfeO